ncbi:hypothetical protein C8J56DRAFT_890025 [Mycena floridula]|nr:hypothetical protein C8J56DRAFT_890025 [Mycena floridula]
MTVGTSAEPDAPGCGAQFQNNQYPQSWMRMICGSICGMPYFIPDEFTEINSNEKDFEPELKQDEFPSDEDFDIPDAPVDAAESPAVEQGNTGEVPQDRVQSGPGWVMPANRQLPMVYDNDPPVRQSR